MQGSVLKHCRIAADRECQPGELDAANTLELYPQIMQGEATTKQPEQLGKLWPKKVVLCQLLPLISNNYFCIISISKGKQEKKLSGLLLFGVFFKEI